LIVAKAAHSGRLRPLLAPVATAAAAFLLWSLSVLAPLEESMADAANRINSRPPTGDVVIVEMDARSLREFKQWPWPRTRHAQLVDRLHQSGARMVAFDVDFSARSGAGDRSFATSIERAGNVVLPIFAQPETTARSGNLVVSRPITELQSAWVASVLIRPDDDGTVRSYPAATTIGGAIQPSLATVLAEQSGLADRHFQPDWSIDATAIPRFSFSDVALGRVDPRLLKDKRVVVGGTAIEFGDRYSVPRYGVVPGVVIQALAADSLLQGRAIFPVPAALTAVLVLLIALLFAPRQERNVRRYALAMAVSLAAVVAAPVAVGAALPIAVDSAPLLATLFLCLAGQTYIEYRQQLHRRARTDQDSQLPNRLALEDAMANLEAERTLVVASIDRFRALRDGAGLDAANQAVIETARRIRSTGRETVFRIAPDMLAWLEPVEPEALASTLAALDGQFERPVTTADGIVDIALTFGLDRSDTGSAIAQIERAISAVESAREEGVKTSTYRGARSILRRQVSMVSDLREAIADGRLTVAYQPKMAFDPDAIDSAEALIRWRDVDGEWVSPDHFIPMAEETGAIAEITDFVFERVLADLATWDRNGACLSVAMNVSAHDLFRADFAELVQQRVTAAGIDPSRLTLEVTESGLIRSPELAVATLDRLRAFGVRLAIDDYGTGRSTLSYLRQLPVHELKIDRSFVAAALSNESDAILVKSTIAMAHDLGLSVVAEGVEDTSTLKLLKRWDCDRVQGYLIGKPMTGDELFELVRPRPSIRVA
jgi:EAL domain-containing protein (putative c-di-GMP-specific phosphodiesterase class I)/CHASE2 domain-containing sensor protein